MTYNTVHVPPPLHFLYCIYIFLPLRGIFIFIFIHPDPPKEKSRMEIIVVDGGCRDNTMDAVASMKLDIQVRYVWIYYLVLVFQ